MQCPIDTLADFRQRKPVGDEVFERQLAVEDQVRGPFLQVHGGAVTAEQCTFSHADGRPGGAVWAARRGVDDVLCDHGGREGIDEYVLQPAAFRLPAGARGKTDYILTRASDPSPRGWARGAY